VTWRAISRRRSLKKLSASSILFAGLTGCAFLQVKMPQVDLQTDPLNRNHPDIACIARYFQLEPDLQVGYDGCGNVWEKRFDAGLGEECWILSADGMRMIKLPRCPAQGDTLYTFPRTQ
jgi:hypothetical protein